MLFKLDIAEASALVVRGQFNLARNDLSEFLEELVKLDLSHGVRQVLHVKVGLLVHFEAILLAA